MATDRTTRAPDRTTRAWVGTMLEKASLGFGAVAFFRAIVKKSPAAMIGLAGLYELFAR